MIDVSTLTANELVSKLRSGEISSVELCNKYLDRIKKYEKDIQAWAHLDKKILLEKAEEADDYRKSGKPLGPLHGLPVAVKDIIGTYDMPTECGTVFRKKMSVSLFNCEDYSNDHVVVHRILDFCISILLFGRTRSL